MKKCSVCGYEPSNICPMCNAFDGFSTEDDLKLTEIAFRSILRDPSWVCEILDVDIAEVRQLFDRLNHELNPECASEYRLPELI